MPHPFDLDTPLITFTAPEGRSTFTIRDAVEGVQIFGGIGSGKTSGSGRTLALKYLAHGFGGLVLTAKSEEKDLWIGYCRATNRLDDLIILEPNGAHRFNFLEYEATQGGSASFTENIVQVLKTVMQSSEEKSSGKSDDPFWESALDMLIYNVIDLCRLAYDTVTIDRMYTIAATAPKPGGKREDDPKPGSFTHAYRAAQGKINARVQAWRNNLTAEQLNAFADPELAIIEAVQDAKLFKEVDQFFVETYGTLSEKTRSIIEFSFSGFLFRMLKEPVYSLFCKGASTFTPEDCLQGKIILLNLPVKTYYKIGRDSQVMVKYIWQRAMERRNVQQNGRPVFLWADEAQHFLHEYDAEYQATARSSRIATTYISQNLPNYYANMGGGKSEHRVKSFLGTLGTKIFHANADIETNIYASDLIGEAYEEDATRQVNVGGEFNVGQGLSYKLEKMVRPEELPLLLTGGPENDYLVEGYVHRQGRTFPDGMNFRKVTFRQT